MAQPTDQKLQDDLARNFRELNDYIGNKYTHRHRQQFVDLILHCIFNSLPNDIVQLPLTGKDAKQLDLHVTEATRSFIDDYAYDLWPRLSLEAEGDFALALYWIVKDFVRNAFRIKTDAYAARDRPAELKKILKIPEKDEIIEKWMDKLTLSNRAAHRTMFGHIERRSKPLRETKSDMDLYLLHARQNHGGEG